MDSSPQTPRFDRRTSSVDLSFATPLTYGVHESGNSRRHSKASMQSPKTPKPRSDSINTDMFASGGRPAASNGLGNLADELADAWEDGEDGEDEDDEDEPDMNFQEAPQHGIGEDEGGVPRDSGVDVRSSLGTTKSLNLTPPSMSTRAARAANHHRQQPSISEYDGSDYGGDSDLEIMSVPPGLMARMDLVESLVRRGTENNGGERDGVVGRVIEGLRDLGGQSGVESNATRLSTAHSALSTHIIHQTRMLQNLTYPILSPLAPPLDEETIDEILPLLISASESLPRPTTTALNSLAQLHTLTAELVETLNYISDTLHMSRQTTTTATRRLKSAKELVTEMRREEEAREEGERWLTKGNWSERLGNRECAGVCGDVVGGFEEVCNDWRARLAAQAEAVGA